MNGKKLRRLGMKTKMKSEAKSEVDHVHLAQTRTKRNHQNHIQNHDQDLEHGLVHTQDHVHDLEQNPLIAARFVHQNGKNKARHQKNNGIKRDFKYFMVVIIKLCFKYFKL